MKELTLPLGYVVDDGRPVTIDLNRRPHLLVAGPAGTGKTMLLSQLGDSFREQGGEVVDASFRDEVAPCLWQAPGVISSRITAFRDEIVRRQRTAMSGRQRVARPAALLIDDWGGAIGMLNSGAEGERQLAADMVKHVSQIFMMGRSFNMHCIISVQRAYASSVPGRILANAGNRIVLGRVDRLHLDRLFWEPERAAVRAAAASITPAIRGRGILASGDDQPILFETGGDR